MKMEQWSVEKKKKKEKREKNIRTMAKQNKNKTSNIYRFSLLNSMVVVRFFFQFMLLFFPFRWLALPVYSELEYVL